ncbi:Uncharacterised protein [Mycobacteroides abscessus subsp. abscessus]|nr:Uncharacterised protein [Mycobacteroides abscessus subsp. abscessus]
MQNPLVGAQRVHNRPEGARNIRRIQQHGPRAAPADLDQISPVGVAESRGPLGIDGERPGSGDQTLCCRANFVGRRGDRRHPFGGAQQRCWLGKLGVGIHI